MAIDIKLTAFEGPLDLLLLLIEKNKVDIYDIPIASITDQYLEYVDMMKTKNLDVLSDFLVMASTLLDIKARMLLPVEEDENGEDIDPRTELVQQLIEYREYKLLAQELRTHYDTKEDVFFRDESIPDSVKNFKPKPDMDSLLEDVTLLHLQTVFESVLKRKEDSIDPIRSGFGKIERETVRISEKLTKVLSYGKEKKKFSFRALLEEAHTRSDVVVTFLACLELIKIGQLFVAQEETLGDIQLTWNDACEANLSKEELEQYD